MEEDLGGGPGGRLYGQGARLFSSTVEREEREWKDTKQKNGLFKRVEGTKGGGVRGGEIAPRRRGRGGWGRGTFGNIFVGHSTMAAPAVFTRTVPCERTRARAREQARERERQQERESERARERERVCERARACARAIFTRNLLPYRRVLGRHPATGGGGGGGGRFIQG